MKPSDTAAGAGLDRYLPRFTLLLTAVALCAALLAGPAPASPAETTTLIGTVILMLWPLYAPPLAAQRPSNALRALQDLLLAATATTVIAAWLIDAGAAARFGLVLTTLLLVVQLLLGLGVHRLTLTAALALLALAPIWAAPISAAASGEQALASASLLVNPVSALAVACRCDFLHSPWFYAHSSIGASQYHYPTFAVVLLTCVLLAAALSILTLRAGAARFRANLSLPPLTLSAEKTP